MNLLIIEGAGKVKKISKILNELNMQAKVIATCGHIERLKDSEDDHTGISKELKYNFEFIEGKGKIMKEINNVGKTANIIYIATDPDREGEGIAWHIYYKLTTDNQTKAKRITFNEISKNAIKQALMTPKEIDVNYVNAYLARIALDKKVGYGLSRYLQQKAKLPSAGRVQSVVLKLIKEREDAINNFQPKTIYFFAPVVQGIELKHCNSHNSISYFNNHLEKPFTFLNKNDASNYQASFLCENQFKCFHISEPEQTLSWPSKPFETSTAQTELIKNLKINSKEAEKILQELYQSGYITYPRTDATRMSEGFCLEAYEYVKAKYPDLANKEFRFNKTGGGAQDAHEAIRVVHLDELGDNLQDQLKIAYQIIYERTIINFMNPCVIEKTKYSFINNKDEFCVEAKIVIDQGFNQYLQATKEDIIFEFREDEIYEAENFDAMIKDSTSTPPSPFKQETLIAELKKLGIGRPSTYASSVAINQQRNYTSVSKKNIIMTTDSGVLAYNQLINNWDELINYSFTAAMEEKLDLIAQGKIEYRKYLKEFLNMFENKLYQLVPLTSADHQAKKELEVVGKCPKCNSDVVLKTTITGKKLKECIMRKYNTKTKRISGCNFQEWINN